MNAKEAREKTLEITGLAEKNQLDNIYNLIKEAAYLGKFEIYYSNGLLPAVEVAMRNDGYKTEYSSYRNESRTTISW